MITTQSIVQAKVKRIAADAGLTLATDQTFANTGRWHIYNDDLELVAEIQFNFQNGYSCFTAEGLDGVGYVKADELSRCIERLTSYITAEA